MAFSFFHHGKRKEKAWMAENTFICRVVKCAFIQVSLYSRYRNETNRASVSIQTFLTMPSPSSSPWHSFILVQCPAMCLVPDGGNVCPAVSLFRAGRVSTENRGWSVVLWVPFQSRGWNLSITRNLKKKHCTSLTLVCCICYTTWKKTADCFYYDI